MEQANAGRRPAWIVVVLLAGIVVAGCGPAGPKPVEKPKQPAAAQPAASEKPKAEPTVEVPTKVEVEPKAEPEARQETAPTPEAEQEKPADVVAGPDQGAAKPVDLGLPLVDDPAAMTRLDPIQPVWIDKKNRQVVFWGEVCRSQYPLEFFATLRDRGYESVVVIDVKPSIVHAGLLAVGAEPGHPVQFNPDFVPPTGTEIAVEVRWKDKDGKRKQAPAQEWIRNIETKKPLDQNWVFAGSGFWKDETSGREYYQADGGDFICVLNLPSAMLDLPIRSSSALESRLFEAFLERLPPMGTPVTLVLTPQPAKKDASR